ncbi:hypothetical protein O0882_27580 [Janthinobacterium sp. SUN073]|nr:hypothetical protein [Janthinobacterium sp. SUN073]
MPLRQRQEVQSLSWKIGVKPV